MRRLDSWWFASVLLLWAVPSWAVTNDECLDCHDFPSDRFAKSVHADLECVDCHEDADVEELPHEEELSPVYCGNCHDDAQVDYDSSIHGQASKRGERYAPHCWDCHGNHDILSPDDPASKTFKMNVPYLCGECHREGSPVSRTYDIGQHNIVDNYSQSIHGEGLFKKGLMVTATCNNCHTSHRVLPHTDPNASISPRNIAQTCMQCHSRIEDVHSKVIRGELWEKRPGAIPACTDCHLPHKVRKEAVSLNISDRDCLKCHERPDLVQVVEGDTLTLAPVSRQDLDTSIHTNIPCVKCHSDVNPALHRPCEPSGKVDCSACHAKISDEYFASGHGQDYLAGTEQAPYCTTCHGDHHVLAHYDDQSPTYRAAIPTLCGECHQPGGKAGEVRDLPNIGAAADYSSSVHGRGLTEKGLLPTAVCIDCHGSHMILERADEKSMVNPNNLPATCGTCHEGIFKQYVKSIHYTWDGKSAHFVGQQNGGGPIHLTADSTGASAAGMLHHGTALGEMPTCATCHSSHTIKQVEGDAFLNEVTNQCGSCHEELAETYLETMHGKAYVLGYTKAAKCSDCHGAHDIRAVDDPASTVGFRHIVDTCKKCHEDANLRFTGYLTHATHHDPKKYPALYYTYWAMTFLLLGVFTFFGVHTLMWMPRSFRAMRERMIAKKRSETVPRYYIQRFTRGQRFTHLLVIVSFLSLATTGMTLKFSSTPWAGWIANALGGVRQAGNIHRAAAVITFSYFAFHITSLVLMKRRQHIGWVKLLLGKGSMMFNAKDIKDFWGTLKWFVGAGPRPSYGRFTYWEKFDYLAVFWGVAVIGLSGLMLWFPEFFTRFVPGWLLNVATIVHSDEALLAVGFIFTVHFFNTHLRPEAFPMDTVVFTGLTPLEEYKHDRPDEYERLKASGELKKRVVSRTVSKRKDLTIRTFGYIFLTVGVVLIGLIIYSVLFGYK
ncbi:MAG: cytochrome c3 family protein [Candidatus Eisenbacteria bacterium]|uniref:Cytochrome c3 family protein n=1 Tax=Eiseniibacteriota bacterium TaxID=2212470 RepID=A0A956LXE5_UNCEI|nr:cytochrome c3 family protein [Candidatus Eisenbacteria bacterium]